MTDVSALRQFDQIAATFTPQRRDDLRSAAVAAIGWRGQWMVAFDIEDGRYQGQWACMPMTALPFAWAPISDLTQIDLVIE